MMYRVLIPGPPAGLGSKRVVARGGKAWMIEGSERTRPWQALAIDRMQAARGENPPVDRALRVVVAVFVRRPRSHYRANGELKPSAPASPATGRDIDKIARAVLDAGSAAGWWVDDARVCDLHIMRYYCAPESTPSTVVMMEAID